jgi:hypothetical protein
MRICRFPDKNSLMESRRFAIKEFRWHLEHRIYDTKLFEYELSFNDGIKPYKIISTDFLEMLIGLEYECYFFKLNKTEVGTIRLNHMITNLKRLKLIIYWCRFLNPAHYISHELPIIIKEKSYVVIFQHAERNKIYRSMGKNIRVKKKTHMESDLAKMQKRLTTLFE